MSLREIKQELEWLCMDVMDGFPEDMSDRITEIRKLITHSDEWITKTAHLRLKASSCLWDANLPSKQGEARWLINKADGWIEEAIRIDVDERNRGIPKSLKFASAVETDTNRWIETLVDDYDEGISSDDLYGEYEMWMAAEAPGGELLSKITLGQKLSKDGFEKTSKKVDGKTVRVWRIGFKAPSPVT